MMVHVRSKIRHAVKNALLNKTVAGERVYNNRFIRVKNLPAIMLYTKSEGAILANESPKRLKRKLELVIEIVIAGNYQDHQFDDKVDAFVLQIENCLNQDVSLQGLVSDITLEHTDTSNDESNEIPVMIVVLNYGVTYYTDEVFVKEYETLSEINFSINKQMDGIVNLEG